MSAWTLDQTRSFLAHVADDRLYAAWLLTMHGLRRGEVLGLRWPDLTLDAPEPTLAVRQTRVLVHASDVTIGEPKTARGRRVLPLPASLVSALRSLRDRQASERQVAGVAYQDMGLVVVVDELGRPIRLEPLRRRIPPTCPRRRPTRHSAPSARTSARQTRAISERSVRSADFGLIQNSAEATTMALTC
jgi:integrase